MPWSPLIALLALTVALLALSPNEASAQIIIDRGGEDTSGPLPGAGPSPEQNEMADKAKAMMRKMEKRAAKKRACKADIKKHCPGMKPGDGKLGFCLHAKRHVVSKKCQKVLDEITVASKKTYGACGDDIKKHCSDIQPGQGRVMSCLYAKRDKLSKKCARRLKR